MPLTSALSKHQRRGCGWGLGLVVAFAIFLGGCVSAPPQSQADIETKAKLAKLDIQERCVLKQVRAQVASLPSLPAPLETDSETLVKARARQNELRVGLLEFERNLPAETLRNPYVDPARCPKVPMGTSYAEKVRAAIKPNIQWKNHSTENPVAEAEATLDAEGRIIAIRLVKSSGNLGWDAAVLRALERTKSIPKDVYGAVPPRLVVVFSPNER